jgi:hypothetical protein
LRERELDIKERAAAQDAAQKAREFDAKLADQRWARWTNPLVLAVFAAALAALGNAWLAYVNGAAQREIERTRSDGQLLIENSKAEAARILEVIKTADPEKAAVNLAFLLDAGLIADDARRAALKTFLDNPSRARGRASRRPAPLRRSAVRTTISRSRRKIRPKQKRRSGCSLLPLRKSIATSTRKSPRSASCNTGARYLHSARPAYRCPGAQRSCHG